MSAETEAYGWVTGQGEAFGAPGVAPRWTSSEKDVVGTAYSASSRVWFTVSHGTLNEIYFPTIDHPQTRDMELLITDGETYFHEEKRDLNFELSYVDRDAPAVRLKAVSSEGGYSITKEILSDPHSQAVLMHVRIEGDEEKLKRMKVYALLAPHIDCGGAGNSARGIAVAGKKAILAWKGETSMTMGVDCGFTRVSCGFVGASDGYQDLLDNRKMDWEFDSATNGNIAVMGEIEVGRTREFTLAISFGSGHHAALAAMMQTLAISFEAHSKRFVEQWKRALTPENLQEESGDGGGLARVSHSVLLTHEDKRFPGAFIASMSIPWGATKGDDDLGGYHLVWTRDMVQQATALLACGKQETALRALVYLACTQQLDGGFAQNFWVDGTPYWKGLQLDEVAQPILLAWRLWKLGGLGKFDIGPGVEAAAGCLVRNIPVTQQERWEEIAGYSPSTLAAVISAMVCAGEILRARGLAEQGELLEDLADWMESHLEEWTATETVIPDMGVKRHYMRIRPPMCGDPYADAGCATMTVMARNRAPGEGYAFDARTMVDAGFLELVRYGVRRADDELVVDSLKVVDKLLKRDLPQGPCWRRYNHDGYGQGNDGMPYEGWGQGHSWPLLTGERGHYELAAGRDVKPYLRAMERFSSCGSLLPEQVWDEPDMPAAGLKMGGPAGSAQPLAWAHAEYLKLLRSAADGVVFDRIDTVARRYAGETKHEGKGIEVFQLARPVAEMTAERTLYVLDGAEFEAVWSVDGWKTVQRTAAVGLGRMGWKAELPKELTAKAEQVELTLHWVKAQKWVGRNFAVKIVRG